MEYIHKYQINKGLEEMNMSSSYLIKVYVVLLLILLLLLLFILLGVNAFTTGGVFNSIITGILPLVAGIGVSKAGGR